MNIIALFSYEYPKYAAFLHLITFYKFEYFYQFEWEADFITCSICNSSFFYKKHVYKKHEAEIRQKVKKHLRNIGRLSVK